MLSISTSDLRWMNLAAQQALMAPHDKWRVGAVIVRSGRVLSTGYNRYRNDPAQVEPGGVSYHAEQVALRKVGDAEGSTIYVARVTRSGLIGLAKPCEMCQDLLQSHGVHTAVWTTPDGWGKLRVRELAYV
jgi:tRNA(Arg) A34 adenosine deaminase TadA